MNGEEKIKATIATKSPIPIASKEPLKGIARKIEVAKQAK